MGNRHAITERHPLLQQCQRLDVVDSVNLPEHRLYYYPKPKAHEKPVVISEFGRTFRENGNRGTDHGHGTVYWVLGGGLAAMSIYLVMAAVLLVRPKGLFPMKG